MWSTGKRNLGLDSKDGSTDLGIICLKGCKGPLRFPVSQCQERPYLTWLQPPLQPPSPLRHVTSIKTAMCLLHMPSWKTSSRVAAHPHSHLFWANFSSQLYQCRNSVSTVAAPLASDSPCWPVASLWWDWETPQQGRCDIRSPELPSSPLAVEPCFASRRWTPSCPIDFGLGSVILFGW